MTKTNNRSHIGIRAKNRLSNTAIYILLVVMSVVWLIPFACILLESFRVESTGQVGYIIPKQWGIDNYINLFRRTDFGRWYSNTLIIAIAVAVIQMAFVLMVSFTLSRMRFKGRRGLMNLILVLGMFPGFITMIVLYKVLSGWGMTGESAVLGLILVYTASSGMGYYVAKGYFDTIPRSLDEAARVDGATRLQVFSRVMLPMAKPIVIYTVLSAFMGPWGEFMLASYIAHSTSAGKTVAVGLQGIVNSNVLIGTQYTLFCAGGVLVAIPITILFMLLQKYYVEGVTGGAVKG